MKTLPTQFDAGRLSAAVGTPSCCGCSCCCCCCVGTVVGSTVMVGQTVAHEARMNKKPYGALWATLGVLFLPIGAAVGGLFRVVSMAINDATCGDGSCGEPPPEPSFIAAVVAALGVLALAYWKSGRRLPVATALGVTLAAVAAIALEAGVLLLSLTSGGAALVLWVGLIIGVIVMSKKMGRRYREREVLAGVRPAPAEKPGAKADEASA